MVSLLTCLLLYFILKLVIGILYNIIALVHRSISFKMMQYEWCNVRMKCNTRKRRVSNKHKSVPLFVKLSQQLLSIIKYNQILIRNLFLVY